MRGHRGPTTRPEVNMREQGMFLNQIAISIVLEELVTYVILFFIILFYIIFDTLCV